MSAMEQALILDGTVLFFLLGEKGGRAWYFSFSQVNSGCLHKPGRRNETGERLASVHKSLCAVL